MQQRIVGLSLNTSMFQNQFVLYASSIIYDLNAAV